MTTREALDKAIASGATLADVINEARLQARHVGSTPFKNMIRALQMMTWYNTKEDWVRLAGALRAQTAARARVQ